VLHREDERRVLAEGHQALRTSELDAHDEQPVEMPSDTAVPFVAAVSVLAGVLALLLGGYAVAGGFAVVWAIALAWWLWPRLPQQGDTP
jgi:cytochrome c oxidase subunit 1/cytochrome c oxidase subunit I+III